MKHAEKHDAFIDWSLESSELQLQRKALVWVDDLKHSSSIRNALVDNSLAIDSNQRIPNWDKREPVSTNSHESFNSFSHLLFSLGVKFIVLADKWQQKVPDLLKRIYELYTDYVLKNPFYSLDMPIKWVTITTYAQIYSSPGVSCSPVILSSSWSRWKEIGIPTCPEQQLHSMYHNS